ncbi:MAG: hypothetical protein COA47_07315 [Robiginitomaculum sp.]|nr:MAG: hypothetical protein COA47_07315 [Robiginitomaculum sp.]
MSFEKNTYLRALMAGAAAVGLLSGSAGAQEANGNENIVAYPPTFFEVYNPVTAFDMVRQVPGFSIEEGDNARGFGGTAGNVLIDGERPSTKSTSLSSVLRRIAIERVDRIELVRGSVAGMDMRGQTRVVNVVLLTGSNSSQTTWDITFTSEAKNVFFPTGEIVQTFKAWGADITLGLERNGHTARNLTTRERSNATGALSEQFDERNQRHFQKWQPYFSLARKFPNGDTLNLNAKYWNWTWRRNKTSEITVPGGSELVFDRFDFARADNAGDGGEIGGDFEHKLGDNRSIKFIFLQTNRLNEFDDIFETFDTNGFNNATRILSSEATNESILRSVFNWERDAKNSFEASIEGAYNWLKAGLDVSQDTGSGFQTIVLPVANTKVEEKRAEAAFSWIAKPLSNWTFETGMKYEISEISQSGDASNSQEFRFLKPSMDITWDRNERDQLRVGFRREVGQLNFQDFATSVNVTDNQTNVGNVELRPDTTWKVDFEFERKYGEKGVLILSGNHRWISDVRDQVPINLQFDAPGNIGSGKTWQVRAEARIPTDRIGLKDGILTLEGGFGDSSVTDPLTGLSRVQSFRVDDFFSIDFRQELTDWKMAWGFDYFKRSAFQAAFLFTQQTQSMGHGNLNIFAETTRWKGVTIKLSVDNVFNVQFQRDRTRFNGPRNLGLVSFSEVRRINRGQVFRINLRGTF